MPAQSATTTSVASTTTTTTSEPTTTTTIATTTTIPTRNVDSSIGVYDDHVGDLESGATCTSGDFYAHIREGANVVLEDASTGEVLGVAQLEEGSMNYESVLNVPDDDRDLFWHCLFETTFPNVPLDREFYLLSIENVANSGLTDDLAQVRSGFVGMNWFFSDPEDERNVYR